MSDARTDTTPEPRGLLQTKPPSDHAARRSSTR